MSKNVKYFVVRQRSTRVHVFWADAGSVRVICLVADVFSVWTVSFVGMQVHRELA